MNDIEKSGIESIEKIMSRIRESNDLRKKIKKIKLEWVVVSSDTMPVLEVEFHSERAAALYS